MGEAASPQELPEALPPLPALELAGEYGGVGWQPALDELTLLAETAATPPLALQAAAVQLVGSPGQVEADPRQVAADSIQPGCSQHVLSQWQPKAAKPHKPTW